MKTIVVKLSRLPQDLQAKIDNFIIGIDNSNPNEKAVVMNFSTKDEDDDDKALALAVLFAFRNLLVEGVKVIKTDVYEVKL